MSTQALVPDDFDILIKGFGEIIQGYPAIEKVSKDLDELKQAASLNSNLTFWQKDAIIKRCENYKNGVYGEQVKRQDNRSDYSKSLK